MTTYTDADTVIVNRALQVIGTRTTVTTAEMNALSSNEAKQINIVFTSFRDQLLRMAPWNCGVAFFNLIYLTSQPGTPENTSAYTSFWTPGQPPLGWAYEYLYPDDCLRACYIIPSMITGFAGGVPVFPVPTALSTAPTTWNGPAIKFKVQTDQYLRQASGTPTITTAGSGFAVDDLLICGGIPSVQGDVPAGFVNLKVTAVNGSGGITSWDLQNFTNLQKNSGLFAVPTYDLNQAYTSGLGTGAVATVSAVSATAFQSRVILTNQEYATLAYVKQVTDSSLMDPDFVEAWANLLGAATVNALTGDKGLANMCIGIANQKIAEARKNDGNEGLTVNDVTPDFIRVRGIDLSGLAQNLWNSFDWGPDWNYF